MGTLYVFLDGLFVVSQNSRPGYLEVVLPDVPGHEHLAGLWLAETDIAPGNVMNLRGVLPGTATLPDNLTIHLPQTLLTSRKRAATLWLPLPRQILSLLHAAPIPPTTFVVRTRDQQPTSFSTVAMVQVLIYDYPDENDVLLEHHVWEPCSTENAISLHIISTSAGPEGRDHELATDAVLSEVLTGYPGLEFQNNPRALVAPWIDPDNRQFGDFSQVLQAQGDHFRDKTGNFAFLRAELEHLSLRTARLGRLGRLMQRQENIEKVWSDPDPLGTQASNCATIKT